MANKKRRCRSCKSYKEATKGLVIFGGFYCDNKCAETYAYKNREVGRRKAEAEKKKAFQLSDRKTRKKALKIACHEYIRERDKGQLCICCGRELGKTYHAGHWQESGNNPHIRYDEDNIHAQRAHCNTYKGGDSGDYEKNLRIKIGDERVDRLLSLKFGNDKMNTDDMLKLERYYKDKLKMLQCVIE